MRKTGFTHPSHPDRNKSVSYTHFGVAAVEAAPDSADNRGLPGVH
jgi:hypothetical protein